MSIAMRIRAVALIRACAVVLRAWAMPDDDPGDWLEEVTERWPMLGGIAVTDTAS
jgi:hypothetical protein